MTNGWVVLALVVAGFVGIFYGANEYTRYQCHQFERLTGYPVKYSDWDSCYVSRDGRLWRWDEYKLAYATRGK